MLIERNLDRGLFESKRNYEMRVADYERDCEHEKELEALRHAEMIEAYKTPGGFEQWQKEQYEQATIKNLVNFQSQMNNRKW
jgi:hypothetical protein